MPDAVDQEVLNEVISQVSAPSMKFFDLAISITALHDQDRASLTALSKRTEVGRRRLYYLLDVGRLIERYELTKQEVEAVGWTKLQIVARHLTTTRETKKDHVKHLLRLASNTKAKDLGEALEGKQLEEKHTFMFFLSKDEAAMLNESLLQFGALRVPGGVTNKEQALMAMLQAAEAELARSREVSEPS